MATKVDWIFPFSNVSWQFGQYVVGGGSGPATFGFYGQDEGAAIGGPYTTLNVIGADGLLTPGLPNVANLFIPTPLFSSHFNVSDGNTNTWVASTPTASRRVSSPNPVDTPFMIGGWAGNSLHECTRAPSLSYVTPQQFRVQLDTGVCTFTARVLDANGLNIAQHSVSLTGNYVPGVPTMGIWISLTGWAADTSEWKVRLSQCTFDMFTILPDGGRFTIVMEMNDNGTLYSKTQAGLFYDPDDRAAVLTGVTVGETAGFVITTDLSGVHYYTTGSEFTVNIADMDYLNDSSYPTTQVEVLGTDYGLSLLSLAGSDLAGWNDFWDDENDSYSKVDWAVSTPDFSAISATSNVEARVIDWSPLAYVPSPDSAICVNTYVDNNTRIFEDFKLETMRLESDLTTLWDSTQDLTAFDTNDGLQYMNSRLVYPTIDFTAYNPLSGTQPDYSIAAGDRIFRRRFWHTGVSHSNGLIRLGDYNIVEADITGLNILIDISLDGINWFSVNIDHVGGAIPPGGGCRIFKDDHALNIDSCLEFTLGGLSTNVATGGGWGIFIRVTYKAAFSDRYMGTLEITNWL